MTKQEALQKFATHVDLSGMMDDFPDIDWVVTELDDGQQEIIIRLQGEDVDFRPAADYAVIEAIEVKDIPNVVKNSITLRRHKRLITRNRRDRFEHAIFRRIKALIIPAGISVQRLIKILKMHLPVTEDEQL
jgi:hypothetical protein